RPGSASPTSSSRSSSTPPSPKRWPTPRSDEQLMDAHRCLSVVMPCYTERATIEESLRLVLASPWTGEVIVVDDCSVDGSDKVVEALDDERIVLLRQPVNQGKGAALRRGFGAATFPYVLVQDA